MNRGFNNLSKLPVTIIGSIISALGFVVLIGWYLHSLPVVQLLPTFVPMQFNAALCFILCGTGLMAIMYHHLRVATAFGILVIVLSALTLSQYVFDYTLGIDRLLIEPFTAIQTSHPGRMSPATTICFILTGIGLIISAGKHCYINYLIVLGSVLCAVGITVILGYIVDLPTSFWWGQATRMAVNTAIFFVLLGIGLICVWRHFSTMPVFRWYAASVGIASLIVTLGLWQAIESETAAEQSRTLDLAAANIKDALAEKFDTKNKALERMAGRWNKNGGTSRAGWEADASANLRDFPSFQAISWIDSSLHVQWIMPTLPEQNEIERKEIESNPYLQASARTVRDEQKVQIIQLVNLPNGNNCLFIFIPVFRGNEFDGEIVGIINIEKLVKTSLPEEMFKDYSINIYEDDQPIYISNQSDRASSGQITTETQFNQSGIKWRVIVTPESTSAKISRNIMPTVVLIVGLFISLLLSWATYKTLLSRHQTIDGIVLNTALKELIIVRQRADEELREVAMLKNAILDSANYSIISTEPNGIIITFNRAASKMLGYEPEEVIGKFTAAIFHDIEEVVRRAQELTLELGQNIESGFDAFVAKARLFNTPDENEWTYIRKDGTRFPVNLSVTALRDETGNITGYLGIAQDITQGKKTEVILRENEAKFRDLFDNAPVAYHELDSEGYFTRINHTEELLLGYTNEELKGRHPAEIIVEKVSREATAAKLAGKMQLHPVERTFIRKDGTLVSVLNEDRLIYDSDGNVTGIRSTLQNITERKMIEERQSAILDALPAHICLLDKAGNILEVNNEWKEFALANGYGGINFGIGSNYIETCENACENATGDCTEGAKRVADFCRAVLSGKSSHLEMEYPCHSPNEERWYKLSVTPLNKETLAGAVVMHVNITERKQIETKLKLQQIMLSESQQIAQLGSWEWDLIAGKVVWSDELFRLFGFEPQEFVVTLDAFLEQIHPDDKEFVTKTIEHSLSIREFSEYDARIIQPNGAVRIIHANGFITVDENGTPVKITGTVQDSTERQKMETVLKNACDAALEGARIKSEFLANMSHEIRTPMNGIIGMTELLMDTKLEKEQERYIKSIQSCSESLLTILNDILDISKVEAGMLNFETIDFDLRYSVENVIELLADRAHKKNLEIAMIFQPDVPAQLCGDPTRLRQILTNLVSNAIKFTKKGEIVVKVSKESEDNERTVIRFDVKDTGIGITEDAKKLLFSPFAQADSSITRLYGGTGLGLAISKKLVEMMDGDIGIASEPGEGTTVTFTVSLIKQADQNIVVPSLNLNVKGVRVLIVDDNETNRLILTKQMSEWGMIVEEAEEGVTGIEKLRSAALTGNPFKMVILDQLMPEINGLDIAKLIKADSLIADTHLILMSSYSKRGHGELARQAGIRAYFKKPVRQSELLECLSVVMSEEKSENKVVNNLITQHSIGAMKASLNRHILLVEDNEVNQEVALGHLAGLGYRVDVAVNGEEAVKAVLGKKYDAVLMDCQMPVMDGFQATAEIRKREGKSKHTPIIAMTAYAMTSDRDKCLASGMDAYLSKPVRKAILKEILHNLFENGDFGTSTAVTEDFQAESIIDLPPVDLVFLLDAASNNYQKLEQYVELYTRHTAERLAELNDAIMRQSAKDVFAIAHKCLGSSRTLGMTAIVPALRELERIGNTGELGGAQEQFNIAEGDFKKIRLFLEEQVFQDVARGS